MEQGDKKVSFLLDGGLADRRPPGLRAPVVEQMGSPALGKSDNTRLSIVRGSAVRAPGVSAIAGSLPSTCHGIIPGGVLECAAVLFRGAEQRSAIDFTTVAREGTALGGFPICMIPGTTKPTRSTGFPWTSTMPCVQVDEATGRIWRAAIDDEKIWVWASVTESSGAAAARPQVVYGVSSPANTSRWASLTAHGTDFMCFWYVESGSLRYSKLNLVSGGVFPSAGATVITPASANVWYDVKRLDDNHVIVVTGHPVTNSTTRIIKYNVNTSTAVTTVDITGSGTAFEHAVAVETVGGVLSVAVTIASTTALTVRTYLYSSSLVAVWGPITQAVANPVTRIAIGFHQLSNSTTSVVVAYEIASTALSSGSAAGIVSYLLYLTFAAGTATLAPYRAWKRLASKGTQVKWSATEFTPMFLFHTAFSPSSTTPADDDYVDDPALEVWMGCTASADDFGPVARLGCVRGSAAAFDGSYVIDRPSSSACASTGARAWVDYRADAPRGNSVGLPGYLTNAAELSFLPEQLFTTADRNGLTAVAGSLPLLWDGAQLVEYGSPLSRPHIIASTGGSGPNYPAGDYFFFAVYVWRDQTGTLHRSRPSNVVQFTSAGPDSPYIKLSAPHGFTRKIMSKLSYVLWEVYVTPLNQPDFHRVSGSYSFSGNQVESFSTIAVPSADDPIAYSTGEFGQELTPQPPPPLRDVTIVGARMWGIDGEYPYRIVYSKLRVAGVGYEFHPALEAIIPSSGGEGQRVFELAGATVVLAERAVWMFTGFGPDNTGQGGSFSPPIKLSDFGCTLPHAAAAFPGGLIWANGDRWYVLRGGVAQQLQDVKVGMTVTHALPLPDQDEIAFYGTQTSFDPSDTFGPSIAKVYNHVLDRWTRWNALSFTSFASSPNETRRHYAYAGGTLYKIDAEALADSASMVFEIDLTNLAGDFEDHVLLRDVVFEGQRLGAHGVTIEVFPDRGVTATTTRSFADAAITAAMTAAGSAPWYTLRVEPKDQDMRAARVRITLTVSGTGEGGRPLSLTLCFKPFRPLMEEAFVAGSYA